MRFVPCSHLGTGMTNPKDCQKYYSTKARWKNVIVDPAKINRIHGLLGYLYMRVWVGSYARIICKQKEHPWKWLTKTYVHFGTTETLRENDERNWIQKRQIKTYFPG